MKNIIISLVLIFSSYCSADSNNEKSLQDVRDFITKTRYLVSQFDSSISEYRDGKPKRLITMNKEINSLYKEAVKDYGVSDNGMKPYSDCALLGASTYNLWQSMIPAPTEKTLKVVEHAKSDYKKSFQACKKTTYAHMIDNNKRKKEDFIIIDIDD
ncbi:MAG: hypothetical protein RRZ38_05810 [Hafnia sp.]